MVISAPENSRENIYIEDMKVNGQTYTKNYFTHSLFNGGATIDIRMGSKPNTQRGVTDADLPYSFTNELKKK